VRGGNRFGPHLDVSGEAPDIQTVTCGGGLRVECGRSRRAGREVRSLSLSEGPVVKGPDRGHILPVFRVQVIEPP
jgi:hypothetical protein